MIGSTFLSLLSIVGFLSATWCAGKVSKILGISSIALEILIGLLLAPGLLLDRGLLDAAGGHHTDLFVLCGHAGAAMTIFESGMRFDFQRARAVGPWAFLVGISGTILPIMVGMLLTRAFGFPFYPDGFSVGVCLAPTSIGVAWKLLTEAKCLHKDFGQTIITAAGVNDILSLIALSILFSVASGPINIVAMVVKLVVDFIFILLAVSMGLSLWPAVARRIESTPGMHDEALLILLFGLLVAYGGLTHVLGTHILGCFVAGISFACVHHVHHLWSHQTKRISRWMVRVFFSCTVAFAIPFETLFTFESFWRGLVMGVVACVGTKACCAFYMGPSRWLIGCVMVGRAEFAYLFAEMALSAQVMSKEMFSIVIWALLYATIFAPCLFQVVLSRYTAPCSDPEARKGTNNVVTRKHLGFRFQIAHPIGMYAEDWGVDDAAEVAEVLRTYNMRITHSVQHNEKGNSYSIFQAQPEDGQELEEDALNFMKEEIALEFAGIDVDLKFLPSNDCEFMTAGMAQLNDTQATAVKEFIRAISGDSKLQVVAQDTNTALGMEIDFNI